MLYGSARLDGVVKELNRQRITREGSQSHMTGVGEGRFDGTRLEGAEQSELFVGCCFVYMTQFAMKTFPGCCIVDIW
jgi:hypothetical protein